MLKNKVALVTGASSGIGRAIALVWAREGAKVVVSDVNVQAGEETAALVRAAGGDAIFVAADVGHPADCDALVQRTVAHYGRLDVACNNAGIGGPQAPTADYPLDGWAQVINIRPPVQVSQTPTVTIPPNRWFPLPRSTSSKLPPAPPRRVVGHYRKNANAPRQKPTSLPVRSLRHNWWLHWMHPPGVTLNKIPTRYC